MTNDHPQPPRRARNGPPSLTTPTKSASPTTPTTPTSPPPPSLTGSPFDSDTFTSATFVTVGRGPYLALAAAWLLTRAGMLLLLLRDDLGIGGVGREVALYEHWYGQFATGTFPPGDVTWQYPPGAGLVIMAPGILPSLTYFQAFVALALLADAVITLALARADSERLTHGAWFWVCALPLLLHLPLARYDVQTTALAVLALLALNARSTAAHQFGGALAGIGAMVKVWPALALIGTPRGRTSREAWTAAVTAALALCATLALFFSESFGFLRQQGSRGVQIESLGGTALALARAAGIWPGGIEFRYGSFEYVGPYVSSIGHLALLLTVIAFGWLLLWRVRARRWTSATPLDAAFAAVLLFTATSRVISPQYMIWLLGLAAVCLTSRRTVMRPVALLLLPAAALSSLAYPVLYAEVLAGTASGLTVMVLRNGLLLAASLLAARRLWTSTVTAPPEPTG
ncbi:glycosyltransferase 87 family protein [Streptomyces sp. NBC_00094]|uniref:glycosyltransferase 87 family protein n=1 Tax=Streptomyces sp. NBC_00094 TaxID=2903620 RepID=UPI002256FA06|nr:glycosyltransferase 87 family protein [Streptomyces sp. NBC_00094]MCX5391025.1 glycosyltransferase 87 family protein [Streptomyces sp. NBC_00094]